MARDSETLEDDDFYAVEASLQYQPPDTKFPTTLNIVIHVVGSRGDVQPFIALGSALQEDGHRVRLATHDVFADFVRAAGLEFFPVGGDPAELMAYMVNSPHLLPDLATLREGAIRKKRRMYEGMLVGFWESCIKPDPETAAPFVADAIIANPPSYAHIHCAEALGIPVHLMFTMPWSRTGAFPHPLSGIRSRGKNYGKTNHASYLAVEFLTWQGLGDLVNHWRVQTLDLEEVPSTEGPSLVETLKVPFTYCWSPSLVPPPFDWGSHIDVCGFFFRDPVEYTPPKALQDFLNVGSPPVYIGFGSIVVGDAEGMMAMILQAVKTARVRAIISQGWSKLVGNESPDIFYIGDCPHEWLFQRVAAVVHHGGAGTTACGLRYGRPTAIVPFFGDQHFWGSVINEAGAGPPPIPYEFLTSQKLATAITYCLSEEAKVATARLSHQIANEDGVGTAVNSFYRHLPKEKMTCDFFPDQTAVWEYNRGKRKVKMSRAAATILVTNGRIARDDVRLHRVGNIFIENHRWEPFTAVSSASLRTVMTVADAAAGIVLKPIEEYRKEQPESIPNKPDDQVPDNGANRPMDAAVPSGTAMLPLSDGFSQISIMESPEATSGPRSRARVIAVASASSVAKTLARTTRGLVVDIPVAATEGMRAVPQLWGEQVRPHAHVSDWRSGLDVGSYLFYRGIYEAMTGIFVSTFREKKAQGSVGVAKGLSKGTLGLVTKTTAAVTGLVAYPAQGVSRSIRSTVKSNARHAIMNARWDEGNWLIENDESWKGDHSAILHDFEGLKGRKSSRAPGKA
ncbi:glycosyltransferase family 1 protein [Hypomontagnella monticulosa]|nr:glycosyltransferase family 1 protein [Hypomontagnella monticulosa]